MPKGVYQRTTEQKETLRNRVLLYGFKKGSKINLGRKHTQATKEKIAKGHRGKIPSKKCIEVARLRFINDNPMKKETAREILRTKMMGNNHAGSGENHYKWKGGYQNKLILNNRRRVAKLGNGGTHSLTEWEDLKVKYNFTCPCCKRQEPEIKLARDHITPIAKGGSDHIENIQPLCGSCNSKKQIKIIKYVL